MGGSRESLIRETAKTIDGFVATWMAQVSDYSAPIRR
jgi:hypothetical protein